ncbi:molecular chaperone [Vibrio parahaemolyticus]|nr:molecular chaperone [Vibrio parahaemolyticus]
MNISIHDSLLKRESTLNDYSSNSVSVSTSDIDAAENELKSLAKDSKLSVVLEKQKEAVKTVSPRNTETDISNALLGTINDAALELEILSGWTEGGKAMFTSALSAIFDNIVKNGVSGIELEDTLQIIILEAMVNAEQYGLTDWINKSDIKPCIEHLLESTGSASHGIHEDPWKTPENIAKGAEYLLRSLLNNATISPGTLLHKVLNNSGLSTEQGINNLHAQIKNNYHSSDGWLIFNGGTPSDKLSPLMTMMIMSDILKQDPALSRNEMNSILNLDRAGIEAIIKKFLGKNNTQEWIRDNNKWQIQTGSADEGGHGGQVDWIGNGLAIDDLKSIYSNFPSRILSDEDIKDINRIGDNVKMIMQTLKYWFQILRDERVAIARNI